MDNNTYILRTNDSEIHIFTCVLTDDNKINFDKKKSKSECRISYSDDYVPLSKTSILSLNKVLRRLNKPGDKPTYNNLKESKSYGFIFPSKELRLFAALFENQYSSKDNEDDIFSFCGNCIRKLYKT